MDYSSVDEARILSGLRLVLTAGVPGPWGESAKAMLAYKEIPYIPVRQDAGLENRALQEWTGQNSAPVAILDDESPRCTWLELLLLLERIAPDKPLLPDDFEQRALAIGLSNELAGERGLAWNRRLQMLAPGMRSAKPPAGVMRMAAKYGWSESEHVVATSRIQECLTYFTTHLRMQRRLASDYVVGDGVTAVDFYLANFMGMLRPFGETDNPMPAYMRIVYEDLPTELESFISDELMAHRAMMYQNYIKLPLNF